MGRNAFGATIEQTQACFVYNSPVPKGPNNERSPGPRLYVRNLAPSLRRVQSVRISNCPSFALLDTGDQVHTREYTHMYPRRLVPLVDAGVTLHASRRWCVTRPVRLGSVGLRGDRTRDAFSVKQASVRCVRK